MNLMHAHGSPTNYQYQHGCRCVACRGAVSDYNAAYKASHPLYSAAYYQAHKEEAAAYRAAYYQDHREEALAYSAAYRASHPEYDATYRADHRDAINAKQRQDYPFSPKAEFLEWLQILRTVNGCADCETHEGRLEHHHVDPATKRCQISDMSSCSLDSLEDELEKCVVGCVPCHNKRHVAMRHEGRVSA